jgi:CBS domain-containing protein
MKRKLVSVPALATVQEAAQVLVDKRIGTLSVIDEQGRLIGVVRISDMLKIFMPDFVSLLDNIDFVHDFGVLENTQRKNMPEVPWLAVRDIMQPPVAVEEACGFLRASAMIAKHQVQDVSFLFLYALGFGYVGLQGLRDTRIDSARWLRRLAELI